MSLLADLVATSGAVAATRSRRRKIELLAAYLRSLDIESVAPAVAFLSGVVPQGALGVGWATIGQAGEPAREPSLTIGDVMDAFDELVVTAGPGSKARRHDLVGGLMKKATAEEQAFVRGLLTGEIRQGALEGIMVDAVAAAADVPLPEVRRTHMLNGRIWEVAEIAISGGTRALAEVGLTIFRPVKPMLAQSAENVGEALARTGGESSVEWKLDGIRIQVHRQDDRVEVYTRNLNPVTERLGELLDIVRSLDCRQVVLDGEALFVDGEGKPARFQETAGRFSTDVLDDRGIRPFFFDVLHVDGEDLIDRPLRERRQVLEKVAGAHLVPQQATADRETADAVLATALDNAHEGVMVKSLDSAYEAGRRGASWIKVKPVLTLDLIVLAAEWGHGRREGWLSNLHLGARGPEGPVMVGKTFKGMTDELLNWQTERLQQIEERRTRATVFVRPQLVVEIALDGVQVSTRYPGGVALRFARLRGYRPDKNPADADTIDTVRSLAGLGPLAS